MRDQPSTIDKLLNEIFGDQHNRPNKFTIRMGELIRTAREEKGFSQAELAIEIRMRRATLSDIENGKNEPNASELLYLAAKLEKPLTYFFPRHLRSQLSVEDLSPEDLELLLHFREIYTDELMKIAIHQVKVLAEYDPKETLLNSLDFANEEYLLDQQLEEFIMTKGRNRKPDL